MKDSKEFGTLVGLLHPGDADEDVHGVARLDVDARSTVACSWVGLVLAASVCVNCDSWSVPVAVGWCWWWSVGWHVVQCVLELLVGVLASHEAAGGPHVWLLRFSLS